MLEEFTMRKQRYAIFWSLNFAILALVFLAGCSHRNPSDLRQWYSENYPRTSPKSWETVVSTKKPPEIVSVEPGHQESLNIDYIGEKERKKDVNIEGLVEPDELNERVYRSDAWVKGQLQLPVDVKLAAESENQEQYGAASMIESKLFRLVEDAYDRRDPTEFVRLYNFFLESFPHSSRKAHLDEKLRSFFYTEKLDISKLKNALVEITYPDAKTLDELRQYFSKLNSNGLSSIQIEVVQLLGTPIYLFANSNSNQGYYFEMAEGKVVDDLLRKITIVAHEAGLKVMASLPLRHHPQLSSYPKYVMDESWNSHQNRTIPNGKLDLLNPQSHTMLKTLIRSLILSDIDGIVFKDDFTYGVNEGFSKKALKRYKLETGRSVVFNRMFRPIKQKKSTQIEMLIGEDFDDVALWRTQEIKQLLWDLVSLIRRLNKDIVVGFELTPEMILDSNLSVRWYSTGLHYLKDLNVDFFVLKWRKHKSDVESEPSDYKKAAFMLREAISKRIELFVKVPLSDETQNVIKLNRRISQNTALLEELSKTKIAIGPVSRVENNAFLK